MRGFFFFITQYIWISVELKIFKPFSMHFWINWGLSHYNVVLRMNTRFCLINITRTWIRMGLCKNKNWEKKNKKIQRNMEDCYRRISCQNSSWGEFHECVEYSSEVRLSVLRIKSYTTETRDGRYIYAFIEWNLVFHTYVTCGLEKVLVYGIS